MPDYDFAWQRMKPFTLLVLGLCILQFQLPASATGERAIKAKESVQTSGVVTVPNDLLDMPNIPVRYRKGVNQAAVLREFEALSKITKAEFETSEEFNRRWNAAWEKSPISPLKGQIGFVVDGELTGIQFTYDADAGRYKVEQTSSIADFCRLPRRLARKKTDVDLCVVGILGHKTRTYNGRNAFGVGTEVEEERGTYLSISVSRKSPFVTSYRDHIYRYTDTIEFPLEQARAYKTADLKMMLVGEISGTELIDGEGTRLQPSLDSPYDVAIDNKGIPFTLKAAVYFFQSDGRILAIRDFRDR
jgi:hypothetical protein